MQTGLVKVYAVTITLALLVSVGSAVTLQSGRPKFEEIDVERINIVEKDGKLRMVISNGERQHPGIIDGILLKRPHGRPPGILFFNHRGDEAGGLVFGENGGEYGHFVSFTMDKSRNDQTIGMQHLESGNGDYFVGLRVWDRPNTSLIPLNKKMDEIEKMSDKAAKKAAYKVLRDKGEFGRERISVAKLRDKSAEIALSDANGTPRIKITVDATGNPRIVFLDEDGKPVYTLPEDRVGAEK